MTRRLGDRSLVTLRVEDHTYILTADGIELGSSAAEPTPSVVVLGPSVSSVASSLWPDFNSRISASRCGPEARLKWTGSRTGSDEAVMAAWEQNRVEAASRGTRIHADIETLLLGMAPCQLMPVPETLCPVVAAWIANRYPPEKYLLFPELIVYGTAYDGGRIIPGTIDLAAVHRYTGTVTLVDWKTGSVDDKKGAKDPVFGIKGTRLAKYSIQLGLYKLILERHYGVTVDTLEVVQITPGFEPTVYPAKPELTTADLCASIAAMVDDGATG